MVPLPSIHIYDTIQNCVVFEEIMKISRKFCRNVEKVLWKIMTYFWKFKEKFVEILEVKIIKKFKNILL